MLKHPNCISQHVGQVAVVARLEPAVTSAAELLDRDYTRKLIQIKAKRLVQQPGFTDADRDDVEQELRLRLLRKAHHFESSRGSLNTFVARVVKSGIVTLVRERRRQKRRPTLPQRSLAEPVMATETTSLADVLSQSDADRRLGNATTSELQQFIDQDAVAVGLQAADPQLRKLFERLESGTVAVVARHLGLSRHQRRRLLAVNKPAFVRAGFDDSAQIADSSMSKGVCNSLSSTPPS